LKVKRASWEPWDWVYELDPKARVHLQRTQLEPVAPRSVFAPALKTDWAQEEMAGVDLGDERLNARAARMLGQRGARPTQSFFRSFDNGAEAKGAYKLIENGRAEISLTSLLAPHQLQTARRMAAEKVVLLAQDTTGLSYNTLAETTGLGSIGERGTRGLFLHSLQAFRLDGIPLGTLWAEVWARPPQSERAHRNAQSCDEKESGHLAGEHAQDGPARGPLVWIALGDRMLAPRAQGGVPGGNPADEERSGFGTGAGAGYDHRLTGVAAHAFRQGTP
jgi:hypothetical protein